MDFENLRAKSLYLSVGKRIFCHAHYAMDHLDILHRMGQHKILGHNDLDCCKCHVQFTSNCLGVFVMQNGAISINYVVSIECQSSLVRVLWR